MRYILLGTTMMAASFALPFVDMSAKPKGQPVAPVEVSVLTTPEAAPDAAPGLGSSLGAPQTMPVVGALMLAEMVPFSALNTMWSDDSTDLAEADLPAAPPMFAILPDTAGQPETVSFAADPVPEAAALPEATAVVADAPAQVPDVSEELAVITGPSPAPERTEAENDAIIEAILADDGDSDLADVPAADALVPLAEDVGSLTLDDSDAGSVLTLQPEPVAPIAEETAADVPAALAEAPAPEATVVESDEETVMRIEVTASYLNLRAGPSSSHTVVFGLSRGAEALVIEEQNNGWTRVRVPETGQEGWAFSRYLQEVSGA